MSIVSLICQAHFSTPRFKSGLITTQKSLMFIKDTTVHQYCTSVLKSDSELFAVYIIYHGIYML